jgi:uncharacterized protein YegJ (DUF2314 family)
MCVAVAVAIADVDSGRSIIVDESNVSDWFHTAHHHEVNGFAALLITVTGWLEHFGIDY